MIVASGYGSGRACGRACGPLSVGGFTQESAVVRALPGREPISGTASCRHWTRPQCWQMPSLSTSSLGGIHSVKKALKGSKLSSVAF